MLAGEKRQLAGGGYVEVSDLPKLYQHWLEQLKEEQAEDHDFKLADKCPMCEKPVDGAPNVLNTEEATAIVSAAFGEDHDGKSLDAVVKRLGDWVDAELAAEDPIPIEEGDDGA